MRFSISFLALVISRGHAFVVVQKRNSPSSSSSTTLSLLTGVGGGVPVHPAGDRHLFDPAQEGKLGGTDNLDQRLAQGSNYLSPVAAVATSGTTTSTPTTIAAQHWLLENENDGPPSPFAKPTQPVTATVLGRGRLITDDAPGDIEHIVLQLPEGMHYVEGQSLSVIPPGTIPESGKPHKPRLYSIAR